MTLRGPRTWPSISIARRSGPMDSSRQPSGSRLLWLSLLIGLPLVLALIDSIRDLYCDTTMIREVALRSEMGQLRSQTIRRASRMETVLELSGPADQAGGERDWTQMPRNRGWRRSGRSLSAPLGKESYLAVVDPLGDDRAAHQSRRWSASKSRANGTTTRVATQAAMWFASGRGRSSVIMKALDVHVPLYAGGSRVGRHALGSRCDSVRPAGGRRAAPVSVEAKLDRGACSGRQPGRLVRAWCCLRTTSAACAGSWQVGA